MKRSGYEITDERDDQHRHNVRLKIHTNICTSSVALKHMFINIQHSLYQDLPVID